MKAVTIIAVDAKSGTATVQVMDIDPSLFGVAMQRWSYVAVDTQGAKSAHDAVAAAFPDGTVFDTPAALSAATMDMLVAAGLRTKAADGSIQMTTAAKQIDAGTPAKQALSQAARVNSV